MRIYIYIQRYYSFYGSNDVNRHDHINIGGYNDIILYIGATSWVIPRFVNSNPDPNNVDTFEYRGGIGSIVQHVMRPYLNGSVDTIFLNSFHTTWSGTYYDGYGPEIYKANHVIGKLTRNGVTTDVEIQYFVPPFDTSIVVIEY